MRNFKLKDKSEIMDKFRESFRATADQTIFDQFGYTGLVQPRSCEYDEVLSLAVFEEGTDYELPINVKFYFVIRTNSLLNPFYVKIYPGPKAGLEISMDEMSLSDGLIYLVGKLEQVSPQDSTELQPILQATYPSPF